MNHIPFQDVKLIKPAQLVLEREKDYARLELNPAHRKNIFICSNHIYPFTVLQVGKGSGFGKVILFGEHFVVHGVLESFLPLIQPMMQK